MLPTVWHGGRGEGGVDLPKAIKDISSKPKILKLF
jgi:hypothetical protein